MLDPHDDTNVPSGSTDGAQMESTSSPVPREQFQLFLTGLTPANSMRLKAGEWKATSQVLDRKRKRGGKGAGDGAGAGWNSNG